MQTNLKNVAGVSADFKSAVDALFDRGEAVKGLLFTRYPELKTPYAIAIAKPLAERHTASQISSLVYVLFSSKEKFHSLPRKGTPAAPRLIEAL